MNPSPQPREDPSRPGLGEVSGIFINVHSQASSSPLPPTPLPQSTEGEKKKKEEEKIGVKVEEHFNL